MVLELDPTKKSHAEALRRLETEEVGWVGTIGRDGFPHAVPVWFLWHDGAILVFSQPHSAKVRNLEANPHAMFHLEAGADGEQMHVLQGVAELSDEPATAWFERIAEPYWAKYRAWAERMNLPLDVFPRSYSVAIVLRPHKLLG
jgi:PPOX class probable F420-dependent enzyme